MLFSLKGQALNPRINSCVLELAILTLEVVMSKAYPKLKNFKNFKFNMAMIASVFLQETPISNFLDNSAIKFKSIDGLENPTNLTNVDGTKLKLSVLNLFPPTK